MNDRNEPSHDDHGPFAKPLFDDPSARALSRVGVVDVGSNSVRMVVFDGAARSPAYFYNEKVMCGLGLGLAETGRLNPRGRERALAALRRFALLAEGMNMAPLTVVATAAVREAADGQEFSNEVLRETGLRLWVISGDEEARLSAQGVLLGWPDAKGIVCDIGGSSMELAQVGGGKVGARATSPLGPFRLQQVQGGRGGADAAAWLDGPARGCRDLVGNRRVDRRGLDRLAVRAGVGGPEPARCAVFGERPSIDEECVEGCPDAADIAGGVGTGQRCREGQRDVAVDADPDSAGVVHREGDSGPVGFVGRRRQ